jgi:hypothetical protein
MQFGLAGIGIGAPYHHSERSEESLFDVRGTGHVEIEERFLTPQTPFGMTGRGFFDFGHASLLG